MLFATCYIIISSSSQGCDLPEQSTVHVVLPKSAPTPGHLLLLRERLAGGGQEEGNSLARLDISSSRFPCTPPGLDGSNGGGGEGAEGGDREQMQAASLKGELRRPQCQYSFSTLVA